MIINVIAHFCLQNQKLLSVRQGRRGGRSFCLQIKSVIEQLENDIIYIS